MPKDDDVSEEAPKEFRGWLIFTETDRLKDLWKRLQFLVSVK